MCHDVVHNLIGSIARACKSPLASLGNARSGAKYCRELELVTLDAIISSVHSPAGLAIKENQTEELSIVLGRKSKVLEKIRARVTVLLQVFFCDFLQDISNILFPLLLQLPLILMPRPIHIPGAK